MDEGGARDERAVSRKTRRMTTYSVTNLSRNSAAWMILASHHIDPRNIRDEVSERGYEYRATDAPQVIPWPREFRFDRWLDLVRNTPGARVIQID